MPSKVTLVAVLGLLGFSMGLPVDESVPYNPQDFYSLPYTLDDSNAPEKPAANFNTLPYNPQDFYSPSYTLGDSNAPEKPAANLNTLPYNPQDFYSPSYTLDDSNAPEKPAANLNTLPYNPKDFYSPPVVLDSLYSENSGRLVGGTAAKKGAAPFMAALVVGDLIRSFMCGGTIVTPRRLLTAAHCIDPMVSWIDGKLIESARGQIGSNSLSKGYTLVRFAGYENHPDWNQWLIKNDIGVLELVHKLTWSESVQPLKLSDEWIGGGQLVRVTGWGRLSVWGVIPDWLQELSVHVLSPEQCEAGILQANELLRMTPPVHPEIELCTLHKRGEGYGFCNGDSGSPLIWKGRQVAIVSWGVPCARGFPDVSARISGFLDWLSRVLRE